MLACSKGGIEEHASGFWAGSGQSTYGGGKVEAAMAHDLSFPRYRFLLPQVHTAGFSKEEVEVILSLIDRDDVITHWLTASTNGAVRLKLGEILHKILSSESGHSSHDRCQRSRCCAF
jgi:hypothetical protein